MYNIFLNFLDSQKLYRIIGDRIKTKFYYGKRDKQLYDSINIFMDVINFEKIYVPAYTDAELNKALPHKIKFHRKSVPTNIYDLIIRKTRNGKYQCEYENQIRCNPSLVQIVEDSEVEAKAKLLFFLNKNKLLKHEN